MAGSAAEGWQADAVLFLSLTWLSFDLCLSWDAFEGCPKPIHKWLLASYLMMVAMRLACVLSARLAAPQAGYFLLNLRQSSAKQQAIMNFTWLVITPLFTLWTLLGTVWIVQVMWQAPQQMPSGMHFWILIVWQVMSYLWFCMYGCVGMVAWRFEQRLRTAEVDLRALEDGDVLARWGRVSNLEGYRSLPATMAACHPQPSRRAGIPQQLHDNIAGNDDCPICLEGLQEGESVRELTA
eukprot:CAMPEP_0115374698 /NCGR_PEP_ID=MMETSP0271-20121206/2084_1 /TAXON_ID=71861 /ORGANISM="Scrippsiella trochoidea, Strain CCMP3099" /LENGTH=237 /DNA_ID=CAMNT_0002797745 /DNA_START=27 /DNA_END=737 /DNA_ORIENTATION=-